MRKYLTTWLWYEDHLCSLSSSWLSALLFVSLAGVATLTLGLVQFWDDLAILIGENDARSVLILAESLILASAALWVSSCCLVALGRRLLLERRGL